MKKFKLLTIVAMSALIALVMVPNVSYAQTVIEHGPGFVDENGDGYNDNAPDFDNDGIPNGQDPDYQPLRDSSGQGRRMGNGSAAGTGNGKGYHRRFARSGDSIGNGGRGTGVCDGTGPKGFRTKAGAFSK